jgi:hypothetical protein
VLDRVDPGTGSWGWSCERRAGFEHAGRGPGDGYYDEETSGCDDEPSVSLQMAHVERER